MTVLMNLYLSIYSYAHILDKRMNTYIAETLRARTTKFGVYNNNVYDIHIVWEIVSFRIK